VNLFSRTTTAAVAALALAVPTGTMVATSQAASGVSASAAAPAPVVAKKAKKARIKLKSSAKYSHVGQPGVTLTAIVKKSAKGKVTFSVNGAKAGKAKLKKGKASFTMPSNGPGTYKVTAKYKGAKKSTKIRVYNSAIQVSATAFTISKATPSYDLPELTGSVVFKDSPANKGYVDIYQDGRNKEGSQSPYYCCMASVSDTGTFDFGSYTFLAEVQEKDPGTYSYQAFYTDDAGFDDYIYSTPITVTVTP
jgi:hypothetical protein